MNEVTVTVTVTVAGKILQYTKRVGSNDFETSVQSQNRIIE